MHEKMAKALGLDSLRYLPLDELGPCLRMETEDLCTGCIRGKYPTERGNKLMRSAKRRLAQGRGGRTYE
jgi:glutamine phosphoribosylpyrophosphate amidotransferase